MIFIVTNAETGQPIPNASIDLMKGEGNAQQLLATLVTDQEGKARFVRQNNSCEHLIRPFRETKTFIDLTWATATVSAKGYSPIEGLWLPTAKYEQKPYGGGFRRVEFSLPLGKQVNK